MRPYSLFMKPRLNCRLLHHSPSAPQLDQGFCRRPLFGDDAWVGTQHAWLSASRSSVQPDRWAQRPALPFMFASQHLDGDRLVEVLQQGAPFAEDVGDCLVQMTGLPITQDGLLGLYQHAAPHLTWHMDAVRCISDAGPVTFTLHADDRAGRPVFRCSKVLYEHADLALELHAFGLRVLPRARYLIGRTEALEERLLRELSPHPRTRLTLAAGVMADLLEPAQRSFWGTYGHSLHGYQFDDAPEAALGRVDYPPRVPGDDGSMADCSLLQRAFSDWLMRLQRWSRLVDASDAAVDMATYARLQARIAACRTPHDFATVGEPGLHVLGQSAGLGEAFLTSGAAPWWRGVRYVNACRRLRDGFERGLLRD